MRELALMEVDAVQDHRLLVALARRDRRGSASTRSSAGGGRTRSRSGDSLLLVKEAREAWAGQERVDDSRAPDEAAGGRTDLATDGPIWMEPWKPL